MSGKFLVGDKVKIVNHDWIYPGGAMMDKTLGVSDKWEKWWGKSEDLNGIAGKIIGFEICTEEVEFYLIDIGEKELIVSDMAIEKLS